MPRYLISYDLLNADAGQHEAARQAVERLGFHRMLNPTTPMPETTLWGDNAASTAAAMEKLAWDAIASANYYVDQHQRRLVMPPTPKRIAVARSDDIVGRAIA
jgi:hypothetical protein